MTATERDGQQTVGSSEVGRLIALWTLERAGTDVFRPTYYPQAGLSFVFGGQLLAQSLQAAAATVAAERLPNSLHAHFFAAGRPDRPLTYHVERVRDGGSFSTRRVHAEQDGSCVFAATASFNVARPVEQNSQYQLPMDAVVPTPDDGRYPWTRELGDHDLFSGFELREMPPPNPGPDGVLPYSRRLWFRVRDRLPDDPVLHSCALAFASDFGVTIAASVAAGLYGKATVLTSLDHGLWFHRPARADEWVFTELVSVSNFGSRGFVRGTMHSRSGTLIGSLAQETLVR